MKASKIIIPTERKLWQWKVMEYLAYAVVFITPLYFNNKYHLFTFSPHKTIIIIGIVSLMAIFYAWGMIATKKISFRFNPLHIVSIIFLLSLTISSIFGVDPLNSFFGRWREGISLTLIYAVTAFAFFVGFLIKKNKSFLEYILLSSFVSSVSVAIISFAGSSLSKIFEEGSSTMGNSSYTGAYLLFNACFGIGLFLYYSKKWQKILIAIGTFIIGFCPVFFNKSILLGKVSLSQIINNPQVLFGEANAAAIGLGFSVLIILVFFLIFSSKKWTKIAGVVSLFIILIGSMYVGLRLVNPDSSIHRAYVEAKNENRFVTWDIARSNFDDHKLLGSGFNNFSYTYQKYFTIDILKEKYVETYFHQVHNVILEFASNSGILGLLSFLALMAFTFLGLFKVNENVDKREVRLRIVFIGLLFGYFVQNLFGFDTPVNYLMLYLLIGLAIGLSYKEWNLTVYDKYRNWVKAGFVLLAVSSLIYLIMFSLLPLKEFKEWSRSTVSTSTKERIMYRNKMQEVSLMGGVFDSTYLADKFFDLYKVNIDKIKESKNKDLYLEEVQSVISQIDKGLEKQPNEIRGYITNNQLFNIQFFIKGGKDNEQWDKSLDYIKKAISLNPINPELYLVLSQTYAIDKDFKNSFTSVRQAIAIAPLYKKSYDYAHKLLNIKPDADFQKYLDTMEKRWLNPAS